MVQKSIQAKTQELRDMLDGVDVVHTHEPAIARNGSETLHCVARSGGTFKVHITGTMFTVFHCNGRHRSDHATASATLLAVTAVHDTH
jgi:hypothetical protein